MGRLSAHRRSAAATQRTRRDRPWERLAAVKLRQGPSGLGVAKAGWAFWGGTGGWRRAGRFWVWLLRVAFWWWFVWMVDSDSVRLVRGWQQHWPSERSASFLASFYSSFFFSLSSSVRRFFTSSRFRDPPKAAPRLASRSTLYSAAINTTSSLSKPGKLPRSFWRSFWRSFRAAAGNFSRQKPRLRPRNPPQPCLAFHFPHLIALALDLLGASACFTKNKELLQPQRFVSKLRLIRFCGMDGVHHLGRHCFDFSGPFADCFGWHVSKKKKNDMPLLSVLAPAASPFVSVRFGFVPDWRLLPGD